jgi:hypothetical protein
MYKILTVMISMTLLVSACGPSQAEESTISTAVAQTVQAGQAVTATTNPPTLAPQPPILDTTLTPAITPSSAPTLVSAPPDPNCAKASLIAENPPDETILTPGTYFWKTWTLQNAGTCPWTTAYQLVFWSGDRLGSSLSYPMPDDVAPGETIDLTIYLQAPETGGTFTGSWRIKTPWESNFGVGQYDVDISTSIVVGSLTPGRRTETVFGVTSVTYSVDRRCAPANTFYTITAYITSNGPLEINFMWMQSDGNNDETNRVNFTEAATKAISREWSQHKESSTNERWAQVIVTDPTYQEFDKVLLPEFCNF